MVRALDWIAGQFAEAVADIRRRVVEEPWFGKPLDGPTALTETTPPTPETPYDAWAWKPDPRVADALREERRANIDQDHEQIRADKGVDF